MARNCLRLLAPLMNEYRVPARRGFEVVGDVEVVRFYISAPTGSKNSRIYSMNILVCWPNRTSGRKKKCLWRSEIQRQGQIFKRFSFCSNTIRLFFLPIETSSVFRAYFITAALLSQFSSDECVETNGPLSYNTHRDHTYIYNDASKQRTTERTGQR